MQEPLEIRVLGPFEVLVGETQADVGGAKRQGLLAMLALRRGRVVAVDALIDGLWGAELPSAPRNALHHHVARLRAALGEDAILGSADGYALADARIDAVDFEKLLADTRAALRDGDVSAAADTVAAAAGLWRGPALQGLTGTAWFDAEARRLESLHADALEEHFEVALALGEHRELVPELRSALADNPFRERLWGQLMLALYRSGRQADALETFQEARRVLSDELGLEPGPELRRLQEAILAQDTAIAAFPAGRRRRGNLPAPAKLLRGPRRRARPGRGAAARAPPRDAHRPTGRGQEPARGRGRTGAGGGVPRRHLGRRLRRGRRRGGGRCPAPGRRPRGSRRRSARRRRFTPSPRRRTRRPRRVRARPRRGGAHRHDAALGVGPAANPGDEPRSASPARRGAGGGRAALAHGPGAEGPSAAAELFLERARAARPGFEADGEAVALAAEIARRVDGLPLALELAAARVNVLGLGELVSILERRAELLRDTPESDPARAALKGLVDWSYDLLHGDEKALLHQLAVHRGGASRDSLVAVAATQGLNEATVNYLLSALVDKSIVTVSFSGDAPRYDMLDSVREYVLARLAEDGSLGAVRGAHADYFARLAEEARDGLRGPEWQRWQARLGRDNDNLWAALTYAREARGLPFCGASWHARLVLHAGRARVGGPALPRARSRDGHGDDPADLRVELLATLCYLAVEELDLAPRSRPASARSSWRRRPVWLVSSGWPS